MSEISAKLEPTFEEAYAAADSEVEEAYTAAVREVESLPKSSAPTPTPTPVATPKYCDKHKPRPEEPPTPRHPCTEHREKVFVFSNGEVAKSCSADGCGWGKTHKRHSDRIDHSLDYLIDAMPTVEPTSDDEGVVEVEEIREIRLSNDPVIRIAGEDEPEPDDKNESEAEPIPAGLWSDDE